MDEAPLILALFLLAVFVVIVAPLLAILAWVKVKDLERRVNALAQAAPTAVAPAPPAVAPGPSVVATPALARPVQASPPVPVAAAMTPAATPLAATPTSAPAPPAKPAVVRPPKSGTDLERLIAGRWLNRVGLLAVAVGVGLFLKAAIDNDWIGPAGQVAIGLLLGTGVIASTTWFLKHGYRYFADGLTGLGAAILYLSLWAASGYYHLISPTAAFAAMTIVTAGMIAIALGRNSQRVAALALAGGFLTPMLVSTGQDAQVALFSYLAVQDAVLLVLAFQRDWRWLELPAFVFTQVYFWGWYDQFYVTTALVRTASFAALFFVIFGVLPVIRSRRRGAFRIENGLVMALNVTAFLLALHTLMWPEHRWLLTACTLGLAVFYLIVVRAVPDDQPLPRLLIGGLALTLVTIAIPMRLSERYTTIAWAVEAAVLTWIGFRVKIWQIRTASFVLFMINVLMLFADIDRYEPTLWNARFVGSMATVAAAFAVLWIARLNRAEVQDGERPAFGALAVAANILFLLSVTAEIGLAYRLRLEASHYAEPAYAAGLVVSLFWTLYASVLLGLGVRARSPLLRWQGLVLFGVTTLKVFFVDLSDLSGFYRILSAIALGVVLLIVSFFYQRKLAAGHREEAA